jgi:hypothetical protein
MAKTYACDETAWRLNQIYGGSLPYFKWLVNSLISAEATFELGKKSTAAFASSSSVSSGA